MNRFYTSIEQSKKLLQLGMSPESADMYVVKHMNGNPTYYLKETKEVPPYPQHFPCWSVGALLEVMPPYLFEWEKGIDLEIYPALNKSRWQVSYISRDMSPENNDRYTKIMFGDTPLEAAFNMVVWLLENNYIKQ